MGYEFQNDKHPLRYRYHNQANFLTFILATLYLLVARDVFLLLGFPPQVVFFLLLSSYLGSGINIPLFTMESTYRSDVIIPLNFFGFRFAVPRFINQKTLIAINVGGAVIPLFVSILLLMQDPTAFPHLILPLGVASLIINQQAKLVPGMGVTLPALFAPTLSVLLTLLFLPLTGGIVHLIPVVYITASMGSLIGADLMNLRKIPSLGSPMVSIGGAGTFDGVFMGGILAISLIGAFLPQVVV